MSRKTRAGQQSGENRFYLRLLQWGGGRHLSIGKGSVLNTAWASGNLQTRSRVGTARGKLLRENIRIREGLAKQT